MSGSRQVIVYVGFLLGIVVLSVGIMLFILFMAPNSSFMGVTSVTARQVYTTYTAEEIPAVADVLSHRNIIIESDYIDVEVRVRKAGQQDAGSIQVWENSTGLSFNSIKRTHVEWSQVIVERECEGENCENYMRTGVRCTTDFHGVVYYLIKIVEPQGIVKRDGYVFINMFPTEDNTGEQLPFNFILNTRKSDVVFASDEDSILLRNPLKVDKLEIRNASGVISLPAPSPEFNPDAEENMFYVDVGDVFVDTQTVKLKCLSPVRNNVWIKCNAGQFAFGKVGKDFHIEGNVNAVTINNIGGNVKIVGKQVGFTQKYGVIDGDINFQAPNGYLSVEKSGAIYMRTANAYLAVQGMITSLDYESTKIGYVNVAQVGDEDSWMTDANTLVETVTGSISIFEIWVDTSVKSTYGAIRIDFSKDIPLKTGVEPALAVKTYDGTVTAGNICGLVDINVRANGNANVFADFRQVTGAGRIFYEGSTNPNRGKGDMTVTFIVDIAYCNINIDRTSNATNSTVPSMITTMQYEEVAIGPYLINDRHYHVNYNEPDGSGIVSTGNLRVSTTNKLTFKAR